MARDNYYNEGDKYSQWHRYADDNLGMIDLDQVEICRKCYEPLFLAETCYDKNQTYKTSTTTRRLAERAKLDAYLVFYQYDEIKGAVIGFRVQKIAPFKSQMFQLTVQDWIGEMAKYHEDHKKFCIKETG